MDADDGALGDGMVQRQHLFERARREAVPRDVDDVVGAAHDEDIAVGVDVSGIARRVEARERIEIRLAEPLEASPDAGERARRQRKAQRDVPLGRSAARAGAGDIPALAVEDAHVVARHRHGGGAGLGGERLEPDGVRADRPAGLGLPPVVDDRHAEALVRPVPRLGVEPLTGEEQRLQARQRALGQLLEVGVDAADGAQRRGRREHRLHVAFMHGPPELPGIRRSHRLALVEHGRRSHQERPVDDEGVADDPPDVGGGEHRVTWSDVVDVAHRPGERHGIASGVADDSLRVAGRAGGVEDIQRIGRHDRHRCDRARGRGDVIPIAPADAVDGSGEVGGASGHGRAIAHHDGADDPGGRLQRLAHDRQVFHDAAGLESARGRHEHRRPRVGDPHGELGGGEPSEHHRVDGAEPRAGEHRDDRLRRHRQVEQDAVPAVDAELAEGARELGDPVAQLFVGVVLAGAGHRRAVAEGDEVSPARLDMTIEAVRAHVERAIGEPAPLRILLGERAAAAAPSSRSRAAASSQNAAGSSRLRRHSAW